MARTKTAFVFAGGGSLGAVEVGMLRTLNEAEVTADFVVGSSAGAINAAHFAGDPTADGIRRFEVVWHSVRRSTVFPVRPKRGVLALLGVRNSIVARTPLRLLLEREFSIQVAGLSGVGERDASGGASRMRGRSADGEPISGGQSSQ